MDKVPRLHIEKIAGDDAMVQKERELQHDQAEAANSIYGEDVLKNYKDTREVIDKIHDGRLPYTFYNVEKLEQEHKDSFEYLKRNIKRLLESDNDLQRLMVEGMFIRYSIHLLEQQDSSMTEYITHSPDDTIAIDIDSMSNELLADVLEFHVKRVKKEFKEAEKNFEKWTSEFLNACKQGVQEGWLPLDMQTLEKRVNETKEIMPDPVNIQDSAGTWKRWVVSIDILDNEESQRETFFHEMTHSISGKELVLINSKYSKSGGDVRFHRHGFKFNYGYEEGDLRVEWSPRFYWLNEGMTERISMKLLNQSEGVYEEERAAIQKMIDDGVDEQLFINAYFEDRDIKKPKSERVPALRALIKKIHEVYEPGHLMKLEREFEEKWEKGKE